MKAEYKVSDNDVCGVSNLLFEIGKREAERILQLKMILIEHVVVHAPKVETCKHVISAFEKLDNTYHASNIVAEKIEEIYNIIESGDYPAVLRFDDDFIASYALYFMLNNIQPTFTRLLQYYNVGFEVNEEILKESYVYCRFANKEITNSEPNSNSFLSQCYTVQCDFISKISGGYDAYNHAFVGKLLRVLNPSVDDPQKVIDLIHSLMK